MGKKPDKYPIAFAVAACLIACLFTACGSGDAKTPAKHEGPPRDNTPKVLMPVASGTVTYGNANVKLDASHTEDGYFIATYLGAAAKIKLLVTVPGGTTYSYFLTGQKDEVFPLTGGNGSYEIKIYKNVTGDSYAQLFSQTLQVTVANELSPFLYPNQYVNFTGDSQAVALAKQLAENTYSDLEVVTNVYHHVIQNIEYDEELAASVASNYLPDVDAVLERKKGICFDYASVMTAMLRSQGIPTKMESGYTGSIRHAWISTYIDDIGWVDNIIQFHGSTWTLMDPTLAANQNNSKDSLKKYIGDGSNYTLKFLY